MRMRAACCVLRNFLAVGSVILALPTISAAQVETFASGDRVTVRAANPIALERRDETIAVAWSALAPRLRGLASDRVRVLDGNGTEIVSQPYDADADGKPDSLLFQADFGPQQMRSFVVEARAAGKFAPRVSLRHDEPRDDMAWENDRVAFRIYGEGLKKTPSAMSSNGIDVWAKRTRAMIVDKWYTKGHDAYHVDTGEGADFFDVGQTLGVGGTALWRGDSLQRGDNFKGWKVIADGPIRAAFDLRYDPWGDAGPRVSEVKRIIIDAGQHLYRAESRFGVQGGGAGSFAYATGVVKRPGMVGTTSRERAWAWVAGWGPVALKNGGHGELGTAVLVRADRLTDWKETKDHYLAVGRASTSEPTVQYQGAGWTAAGEITSPQAWWAYLDQFAQRLAAPIRVTLDTAAR
jgi:pectinesterase